MLEIAETLRRLEGHVGEIDNIRISIRRHSGLTIEKIASDFHEIVEQFVRGNAASSADLSEPGLTGKKLEIF